MYAMKAQFDGRQVVMPSLPPVHKCSVLIIFEEEAANEEKTEWLTAQEPALSKVWLNEEDAVYDTL